MCKSVVVHFGCRLSETLRGVIDDRCFVNDLPISCIPNLREDLGRGHDEMMPKGCVCVAIVGFVNIDSHFAVNRYSTA